MVTLSKHHINKETVLKPVEDLLKASGVDLSNAGSLQELAQFQEYLSDYNIVVLRGLNPNWVAFTGNFLSSNKFTCYIMRTQSTIA